MSNSRLLHITVIVLAALVLAPWPAPAALGAQRVFALANSASPSLAVTPDAGSPLTPAIVSGSGYSSGVAVSIRFSEAAGTAPVVLAAAVTGPDGSLPPTRITIPADAAPGGMGLLAAIVQSGTPSPSSAGAAPSAIFAVTPVDRGLSVSTGTVAPGGITTVSGSGFEPDTTVRMQVTDAGGTTISTITGVPTTPTGAILPVSLSIPITATAGLAAVNATDSVGNVAGIPIEIVPSRAGAAPHALTLAFTRAAIGQTVGFVADGLPPHEPLALTLLDANGIAATYTGGPLLAADGNGHLQGTFVLPTTAGVTGDSSSAGYTFGAGFALGGNEGTLLTVALHPANSGQTAPATLVSAPLVIAGTRLQPYPAVTTPGHTYTIIGTGFGADEQVTVTQTDATGAITQLGIAQVSDTGVFSLLATAPTPSGEASAVSAVYTVTATGEPSGLVAGTRVVVRAAPALALRPYVAGPGQQVTVQGTAFAPNVRVTIRTGLLSRPTRSGNRGSPLLAITLQAVTDGGGAFSASVTVPDGTPLGPVTMQAQDNNGDSAAIVLTVNDQPASVRVSPLSAYPGQALTVQGRGFGSGETLDLFVANTAKPTGATSQESTGPAPLPGSVITVRADPHGAFAASYPLGATGERWTAGAAYLFGVSGETSGRHAVTDFVIVAHSPPAATPTPGPATGCAPSALRPTTTGGETVVYFAAASTQQIAVGNRAVVAFQDDLEILNTGDAQAVVTVAYLLDQPAHGPDILRTVTFSVKAHAATARSVNADIGNGHLASIIVRADMDAGPRNAGPAGGCSSSGAQGSATGSATVRVMLITHRTQSTQGARAGSADRGAAVLDATALAGSGGSTGSEADGLSTQWFFAGGYAGGAFQEQIMLFNPQTTAAQVHVHLFWHNGMLSGTQTLSLQPFGRQRLDLQAVVTRIFLCAAQRSGSRTGTPCTRNGQLAATGIGVAIDSNVPIVAARALYWGAGAWAGKEGFDASPGTRAPSRQQYFAYASTLHGDRAELSILNPTACKARGGTRSAACAAQVTVSAFTGSGARIAVTRLSVPAQTRVTLPLGLGATGSRIPVDQGVYALSLQSTLPVVGELAQYVGGSPGNQTGLGAHPGFGEPGAPGSTELYGSGYVTASGAQARQPSAMGPLIQVFNPTAGRMTIRLTALSTQGIYFLQNYEVAAGASLALALPAPPVKSTAARTPVGIAVSCSGPCVGVALMGAGMGGTGPVPTEVWDNPLQ